MSNKGLKNYTKQISQSLGDLAQISVNVNKNDANLHFIIPLLSTVGLNPIDARLIFNLQDAYSDGFFGKGFRLNFNNKLITNSSFIRIRNCDGSFDDYLASNSFENDETQMKITKVYDDVYQVTYHYEVKDKYGNEYDYYTDLEYPRFIKNKNGDRYTLDFVPLIKTISNGYGDEIRFYKTGTHITKASYYHNNEEILTADISYQNDYLTSIVTKNSNVVISSIEIEYFSDAIVLSDSITGKMCKYIFEETEVTTILEGNSADFTHAHETTITYYNTYTVIEDYLGNENYIMFDDADYPLYEMNSDGVVIKSEYDKATKNLIFKSDPLQVIHCEPNLFPSNIDAFNSVNATIQSVSVTDPLFDNIVGNTIYKATASGGTGILSYSIDTNGIAADDITMIIWGKQLTPKTDSSYVEVTLSTDEYNKKVFGKETVDGVFDVLVLGVSAKKTYSTISVTIRLVGNSSIELGGIQVIKKQFGSFYEYDNKKNITNIANCGVDSQIDYNNNNLATQSIGESSESFEFDYNNNNNLTKAATAYGCRVENTYHSTYLNNLITNKVIDRLGNKILETNKTYTDDGRFICEDKNELNYSTHYTHDSLGRIVTITNALSTVTSFDYNLNGTIQKIKTMLGSDSSQAQYLYDTRKRLSQILINSNSKYNFAYDSNNNITQISLNDNVLFIYEYDNDGMIISQKYGTNGDKYLFEYNSDKLISKIKYEKNNNVVIKYKYSYNNRKQITSVKDTNNNVLINYYYDSEGRVEREVNGFVDISKTYDNLGNVNQRVVKKDNGLKINQSFDTISRSQGSHPESILGPYINNNNQYITTFINGSAIRSKDYIINSINHQSQATTFTPQYDGVIPYIKLDNNNLLSYPLFVSNYHPLESGSIAFWFRPDSQYSSNRQQLFHCKSSSENAQINLYMDNGYVYLKVTSNSNSTTSAITSDYTVNFDEWNFIALTFMNRYDGGDSPNVCEYAIMLNGHTQQFRQQNPRIYCDLGPSPIYNIGHRYVSSLSYPLYADIACLLIGKRKYLFLNEVRRYYRMSKDYFVDNALVDTETRTVDFSQTNLFTINQAHQMLFDIFPLQNSVTSLKGTKPNKFDIRDLSQYDKDRTFNFNNLIKRYAYVADGEMLSYNFGSGTKGAIVLRLFTDAIEQKQYLFELVDESNKKLGLYRGDDLKLYIDSNGNTISTNLSLSSNIWHTVGFSFKTVTSSGSPVKEYSIVLDDTCWNLGNCSYVAYGDFDLYVGRKKSSVNNYTYLANENNYLPLYGQIEMLTITDDYCNMQTMLSLRNELVGITKVNEYDDFGMLKRTDIHKAGNNILSHIYEYRSPNYVLNHTSKEVSCEKILVNGSLLTTRYYYNDENGNLTTISDAVFGFKSYEYDFQGFLKKDYTTPLYYWYNGNIGGYGLTQFAYSSTIRDLLISVDNKTITYDNNNLFNPISYDGKLFEYEGRRLIKFTNASNVVYNYKYNDKGLRIQKTGNGITTDYAYDGGKLISEKSANGQIDYLYDENDQLFGFIFNNSSRYYYVQDAFKNILGIIDDSGNLITKYDYNPYGKILSIVDTSGSSIGTINPFRYKGYYYDNESDMYYCKSRYYVPEWCRWLNADNPMYLDLYNNICINLFAYCNNNPISRSDNNGKFSWADFWNGVKNVTSVACGVVLGSVVVTSMPVISAGIHIFTVFQYLSVSSEADDTYTEDEAISAIKKITGLDDVRLEGTALYIGESNKVSRRNRILISSILKNTVNDNGEKYTKRGVYGLSAEWAGHNALSAFHIMSKGTDNVDLDYNFWNNAWYTKAGTTFLIAIGWL